MRDFFVSPAIARERVFQLLLPAHAVGICFPLCWTWFGSAVDMPWGYPNAINHVAVFDFCWKCFGMVLPLPGSFHGCAGLAFSFWSSITNFDYHINPGLRRAVLELSWYWCRIVLELLESFCACPSIVMKYICFHW